MNYAGRIRAAIDGGGASFADFASFRDEPAELAIEFLGLNPWSRQAEVLRAIVLYERVAVRSGHKTGKSELLSVAAIWFALTRPGARVVLTAPVYRQVRTVLWKAVKRLVQRLPRGVVLQANDVPDLGIQFANGSEILGFTADNTESFAGISAEHLLFIVDEASGVEPAILDTIEGSAAGGATIVMAGNPTRTAGVFFDAFHDKRDYWHGIHISSEETPNVVEGRAVIPGLATRSWIAGRKADWGEGSALYAVRVRGDFPAQGSNSVVPFSFIETATAKWKEALFNCEPGSTTFGVDPARFGDDESVIVAVRGLVALPPIVHRDLDSIQLAGRVLDAVHRHARTGECPTVRVDSIGIGAGVVDQLRTCSGVNVQPVNASESAIREDEYARVRDELWFGVAEWLKRGGALPNDPKLISELLEVKYGFTSTNKRKVDSKDELRARIGRSPDRADALALAVYDAVPALDVGQWEAMQRFVGGGVTQELRATRERKFLI